MQRVMVTARLMEQDVHTLLKVLHFRYILLVTLSCSHGW